MSEVAECAIAVRSKLTNLRKPAVAEKTTWDPTNGWSGAIGELFDFVATGGGTAAVSISDVNTILQPSQYNKKFLLITGALTAARNIGLPAIAGALVVVMNNTTGGYPISFYAVGGSNYSSLASGECDMLFCDGTDYRSVMSRSEQL